MLSPQVFSDLRLILNWVFGNVFGRIWLLMTTTILSFVIVTWVFVHIIKFFKRLL